MALNTTQLERYYNMPIEQVYEAMKRYLSNNTNRFTLKKTDDISCSCTFTSGINIATWGETLTASALPNGNGTLIRLVVAGKIGATANGFQDTHNISIADDFFTGISEVLSGKTITPEKAPLTAATDTETVETDESLDISKTIQIRDDEDREPTIGNNTDAAIKDNRSHKKAIINLEIVLIVAILTICITIIANSSSSDTTSKEGLLQALYTRCNSYNSMSLENKDDMSLTITLSPDSEVTPVRCIAANTSMPVEKYVRLRNDLRTHDNTARTIDWDIYRMSWNTIYTAGTRSEGNVDVYFEADLYILKPLLLQIS